MFGYIRVCKPELKVKDFETYKAVYCSLCREMGKKYGRLTRFALSYDFAFLALLRMSLAEEHAGFAKGRCVFNPLKKCKYAISCPELSFSASAAVLLVYYKLLDDIADGGFVKRLIARLALIPFVFARKKALRAHPETDLIIANAITGQQKVEADKVSGADAAAEPTAKLLQSLFSLNTTDEQTKRVLERLGYCLGKWIYLADAADDLEKDLKHGNFNPFANEAGQSANITPGDKPAIEAARERARGTMNLCAYEAGLALELLPVKRFGEILKNVIYSGCDRRIEN
ncbi:MAG: DUF5685 family protein [Oscillospiraceae bacterium]|nr:DUF5685 family protein [Oscillospiraceae bacterium]